MASKQPETCPDRTVQSEAKRPSKWTSTQVREGFFRERSRFGETRERSWHVLRKGGVLVTLVSAIPADVAEQHSVRGVFFIVSGNRSQLDQITALVDAGKLRPILSEVLPFARAREAFEYAGPGHASGKIVLQVSD